MPSVIDKIAEYSDIRMIYRLLQFPYAFIMPVFAYQCR